MRQLARAWWRLVDRLGLRSGFATEVVDDVPDALEPETVYLVGEDSLPWSAALLCPCGCGATIQVSLVAGDRPSWRAKRHLSGSVTLRPSIWRNSGCRSHFVLRRGRIVWSLPESPDSAPPQKISDKPYGIC